MDQGKRVHLVGIGGSGMSPIAHILLDMGWKVSGSDLRDSDTICKLRARGAKVSLGHSSANICHPDLVVVSAAVPDTNEELQEARKQGIPIVQRIEMLGQLMEMKKGIAIAGSHGKTTTTSMVSLILEKCGKNPTILIGGESNDIGGSAKLGNGSYLVAEADESNGQFLYLSPTIAVVTNIDNDHLDFYKSMDNLIAAFRRFLERISIGGVAVLCIDDEHVRRIADTLSVSTIRYGLSEGADVLAHDICLKDFGSEFVVSSKDGTSVHVRLGVPGYHNIRNATAALSVARIVGIPAENAAAALSEYYGVHRRFEILGRAKGFTVVDDYAHHPTELDATLMAAKTTWKDGRVIAVFQPHRYSRTKALTDEFARALTRADVVFITDIYSAGEPSIPGVTSKSIHTRMQRLVGDRVYYVPSLDELTNALVDTVQKGDLVLTLGAGNIRVVGEGLLAHYGSA
jgi:UDP-N-acetylmuramate--alanine ligase